MGCSFFDGWKVSNVNRPGCPMPILPQNMSSPKNEILTSKVKMVSFVLTALLCVGTLVYGLLPGLLAVFLGYIFAGALVGEGRKKGPRLTPPVAAAVVVLLPIVGLVVLFVNAKGVIFGAFGQYQALLHHLAGTVLEIRQKLPADLASYLPDELTAVQVWLADYLKSKAHAFAGFGSSGLHGVLLAYVGLVVGALIEASKTSSPTAPLGFAVRQRAGHFIEAFRQIVGAQFWIAIINAASVSLFLLVALPIFGVNMPYVGALVALTFVAGLIPIVGNLICNSVVTVVGISISPAVGLACLLFLIAVHKLEYVINTIILGRKTNTAAWELLAAMFIGEAVFGVPGLVAAPLFYAYVKKELRAARLI